MSVGTLQWAFFWLALFGGKQMPILWLVWGLTLFMG